MSVDHPIELTVVIPTYNEEKRIGGTLDSVVAFLRAQKYVSEIIIADDGSHDDTYRVIEKHLGNFPYQIVRNTVNHGKGFVVRQGMLLARGKYILFTDADLSTPITEVSRFLEYLREGYDVVIGSRALDDSRVEIHQKPLREFMGKAFNRLACLLVFRGIRDSQCGFKCFRHDAAKEIFSKQRLNGFSFDAEIIFLAQKEGFRIKEEPVIWRNSFQSRVRLVTDPVRMFWDLLKIRWMHRL